MIKLEDVLISKFQYYIEDKTTGNVLQEQKGVLRINCLDCLDRTNLTQTKIALRIFKHITD